MDRARVMILLSALLVPIVGLQARLVHLQLVVGGDERIDLAHTRRSVEVTRARRGTLTDSQGRVLAQDQRAFDCYIVLEEFEKAPWPIAPLLKKPPEELREEIESIYERIEKQVRQRPANEHARLYRRERRSPYLLQRDIPSEAAFAIEISPHRHPGLMVRESLKRVYPCKESGSHLAGYLGRITANEKRFNDLLQDGKLFEGFEELIGQDGIAQLYRRGAFHEELIGVAGIEKKYDDALRGKLGLVILEREPGTSSKRTIDLKPSEAGQDIELTVDIETQKAVEGILLQVRDPANRPLKCAVAVIDPATGAVVALASNRLFDPNDFTPPGNREAVQRALTDKDAKPLLSRAFQDQYQLGSAFKVVTSVMGLEEKKIHPAELLPCHGKFDERLRYFNCWIWTEFRGNHGELTLHQALERSCNCFFYETARRCGIESLIRWGRAMGCGQPTGIDLPGEAPGRIPDRGRMENDVLSLAIGQHELMVSPLQAAVMIAAIANGGNRVTPHVRRDAGQPPKPIGISPETLKEVQRGLYEVVHESHGTAHNTNLREFKTAGKTSSAQAGRDQASHAWFVGYAPYDAPKYAFAVLIMNGGHGGETAAPVAWKILERLMKGK